MCEPMTALALASAAATVGGGLVNASQQNAAAEANRAAQEREALRRNQAMREERARQEAFDARARDVNAQALAQNQREAVQGQQQQFAAPRQQAVEGAVTLPGITNPTENPVLSPTGTATEATTRDAARVVSERLGAARQGMLAQAYLRAVGDQQTTNARTLQGANNDLDLIAGGRRGSLNAYNVDLNRQPETFSPGRSMFGDALTAAGRLGSAYAGANMGGGAAAAAKPVSTYSLGDMYRPGFTPPGGLYG